MSGDSSERSSLVDLTFQQLYESLSEIDDTQIKQVEHCLMCRKDQLYDIGSTFGMPSDASQKKVENGTVVLADGITLRTNPSDTEFVRVISSEFNIDQVQALILIHSYISDRGATPISSDTTAQELLEIITPFYRAERIAALRILVPLLRSCQDTYGPLYAVAFDVLPKILQDIPHFVEALLSNYARRTKDRVPDKLRDDPKAAMFWAKQNLKEQLLMLEVLFWIVWDHVSCNDSLVVKILEAAYSTSLGSSQANAMLLLDEESSQLQQDLVALWIVVTVEVFKLDKVAESSNNLGTTYLASNDCLKRLHELISSHTDSRYVCTYLAWTFFLSRLSNNPMQTSFLETLSTSNDRQNRKPVYLQMLEACLSPDAGLLQLIFSLLTKSPVFVTSIAWRTGSLLCDPNATAFRSVIKGLVIALVELTPIEQIPDFDLFVEIWVTLFGRSEIQTVASLCSHFWHVDWDCSINRRAIFNLACSRFPVQFHSFLRLLRCMTGTGFLDTDPLSMVDHNAETFIDHKEERTFCSARVLNYFNTLPSYSQVVPLSACSGSHALYEQQQGRYGTSNSQGLTYINLKPIKLPGGSTLPARSIGRVISGDNSDYLIICWQHQHSGWKLILELLTGYVNRRSLQNAGSYKNIPFALRENGQVLSLSDIGVNIEADNEEALIIEALDLIRNLIYGDLTQMAQLMQALRDGDPVVEHTFVEAQPPDLIRLVIMILEEALGRMNPRSKTKVHEQLIASAINVLAAFVMLPNCAIKVWASLHQTTALFGSDKTMGLVSVALASERMIGHYTVTLSLLHLVQQLFREASMFVLPDNQLDQQFKEEILLRAMRVVHNEIWVEHPGWKYSQLGDKFEISRRVSFLYSSILECAPPTLRNGPFTALSQTIAAQLLSGATMSSMNPLISTITSGSSIVHKLYTSRRFGDVRCLVFLLESHIHLITLLLNYKQQSVLASTPCLLEQIFSSQIVGGASSLKSSVRSKANPIDAIANYVTDKELGMTVPREAMKLLYALLSSLSVSYPSSSTIIGHLSNPEATVESLVTIARSSHDDLQLKDTIWKFIALAVDKEPGLASLFVTGRFRTLSDLEKNKEKSEVRSGEKGKGEAVDVMKENNMNAASAAKQVLGNWKEIWEANPKLLASVLRFVCVVWEHGLEHKSAISFLRRNDEIWCQLQELAQKDLGPAPPHEAETLVITENMKHSNTRGAVVSYAYRTLAKTYAVRLFGLDIDLAAELDGKGKKPLSLIKLEPCFKEEDQLCDLLSDASTNVYSPELYDQLLEQLQKHFPGLDVEQLRLQGPKDFQEFGDGYIFNVPLLRLRLYPYTSTSPYVKDAAERQLSSINMNLSLSDAQRLSTQSWVFLLHQCKSRIRGDASARTNLIANVAPISYAVAKELRSGEVVAMIQQARLSLLLAVLEIVWFASKEELEEVRSFVELAKNVRGIILNEAQSPASAINSSVPFHRPLLQIIYYCVKQARWFLGRKNVLTADQRLTLATFVDATLSFVIQALQIVFITARTKVDVDVDRDMELCVSVFEQCIRSDMDLSSTSWLVECQASGIIRNSLNLYARIDLVGLADPSFLHIKKQAPYAPHLLQLHMALASHVTTAEQLMSEGILTVYSNNFISSAISNGQIDIVLPEFPGERSPAHVAFCSMVSIVATIITALGRYNHYSDAEVCAFVQLYSGQFARALTWTIGDPVTYPLLEEIEQAVNLFYAVAINSSSASQANAATEQVLDFFKPHALNLLQQLNYAITHPNHITSLFEPVVADERMQLEKEKPSADPLKRPLVTRLIHRIYSLSSNVIGALIVISKADSVLLTLEEDWPIHEALVAPYSKVVLDEPASLGTLLELGSSTLDFLQEILNHSPNQNITSAPSLALTISTTESAYAKKDIVITRRNLEGILLYATTQLVMWLSKPDFVSSPEMDFESNPLSNLMVVDNSSRVDIISLKDHARAHKRVPSTLLRGGMTSEVVADLRSLLNKAKPVIAKSAMNIGKDLVDITQVLINFLQDHIAYLT